MSAPPARAALRAPCGTGYTEPTHTRAALIDRAAYCP